MAKPFFTRLKTYYEKVAEVLRGEAEAASIFPNPSDIGSSRESVYAQFLKQHAPSKCNVFLGGFLFDEDGNESKQMDVIISTDTSPRFNFHNSNEAGKSFCPVEGSLGAASIKSTLDKDQLYDALDGIASIPPTKSLEGRVSFTIQINDYENWPYKVIYASNGLTGNTILNHLNTYFSENDKIPISRRPDLIHVAGKYVIIKGKKGMKLHRPSTGEVKDVEEGTYQLITRDPDLHAIIWTLNDLQQNAAASTEILYSYGWIINKIHGI
ncbi:MAG: hypothetical protein COC16_01450 [Lutibacter sp.]|nr:MAG: hypothetical protein COC16_01450 [Lutibacter sp.]